MKNCLSILTAAALSLSATVTAFADPAAWVGKQLPALGVTYLGNQPDLKGKAAIVEFWATWCGPCKVSIPHLNEIHKKFKDKGLVVVGVTDESKDIVEKFQKAVPMEYHVGFGGEKFIQKIGIATIPHALLVDREGKVVWQGMPNQLTEAEIEKALK